MVLSINFLLCVYFCRNEHASREIQLLYKALTGLSFCQTSCKPASSLLGSNHPISPLLVSLGWRNAEGDKSRPLVTPLSVDNRHNRHVLPGRQADPAVPYNGDASESESSSSKESYRSLHSRFSRVPPEFLAHPSTRLRFTIPRPNVKDRLKKERKRRRKERKRKSLDRPSSNSSNGFRNFAFSILVI